MSKRPGRPAKAQKKAPVVAPATESNTWTSEAFDKALSTYFSFGYPDYVREALKLLVHTQRFCWAKDMADDISWKQLRQLLDACDALSVKMMVASSPETAPNVLSYLAQQPEESIVERVADNPGTNQTTLRILSKHSSVAVRVALACNSSAEEELLLALTADEHPDVRYALAENPIVPQSVLAILEEDNNPYVQYRAKQTSLKAAGGGEVVTAPFAAKVVRIRNWG